ncbi:MAG: DnaJ domain-containing protein [Alphaproteobacteria bacterium]|nr:DnaJ domain-containing protein [Alphaproteobacteria bacterium]
MIKKCDFPGCTRAGTCRAPKTRDLREYWNFCREHAAEYNKNWNYYANMTPEEIEADWEEQTFGKSNKRTKQDANDYVKFLNDFITGRSNFDKVSPKKSPPSETVSAFKTLGLPITASWREVGAKYRVLAKKYHPDTATADTSGNDFARISDAYQTLKKYFGK